MTDTKKFPVNQIFCMDCLGLLSQLPDNCISLILTDPPYGIAYQNHFTSREYPVLAGDSGIDYDRFARESYRVLKENSHAYFLPVLTVTRTTICIYSGRGLPLKTAW